MIAGQHQGHLLGDSGYPLKSFLLTPYANPIGQAQTRYNRSLRRTRVLVEQTIGILKRRFGCLHLELRFAPDICSKVFVTCALLHNIAVDRNEIDDFAQNLPLPQPLVDDIVIAPQLTAARLRDVFAQTHFQ